MEGKDHISAEGVYNKWSEGVERVFIGYSIKERFIILIGLLSSAVVAYVFSLVSLPFTELSVGLPLADAFLCASGVFTPGAYIGALLGSYASGNGTFSRYSAITVIFLIRLLASKLLKEDEKHLFCERVHTKIGYSAILVLLQGAIRLTQKGIYPEVWTSLLATFIAAPLMCIFMAVFFSGYPKYSHVSKNTLKKIAYELSLVVIFCAVVYSFRGIRYFGCSTDVVLAVFLTLTVSKRGGVLRGTCIGALLGLISGTEYAVPIAVIGIVSGIFYFLGVLKATGIAGMAGAVTAVFTVGYGALLGFIPEILVALAFASPVIRYDLMPKNFPYPSEELPIMNNVDTTLQNDILWRYREYERLKRLSDAFYDLSDSVKRFENTKDEQVFARSSEICQRVKKDFCESCPISPICWESERANTENAVRKFGEMHLLGKQSGEIVIPKYLSEHCIKLRELSDEIKSIASGTLVGKSVGVTEKGNEYRALSEILSDIADRSKSEHMPDKKIENEVMKSACGIGFKPSGIAVLGEKRKRIYAYGIDTEYTPETLEKVRKSFSMICKTEFEAPFFTSKRDGCMIFLPSEKLSGESAAAFSTKAGENCSGDSVFTFSSGDGYYYAVITDGMGSGEEAADCAEIACVMLEKLLRCGVKKRLAVEMVGDIIRRRGGECFTTVDIMQLDTVTGETVFSKSGAAASYVLRNGAVYCINAFSMPIGINRDASPEEISFDLREGDTVVMMSDGVSSDIGESDWITRELVGKAELTSKEISEAILEKAKTRNGLNDDMTVLTIKIVKKGQISASA